MTTSAPSQPRPRGDQLRLCRLDAERAIAPHRETVCAEHTDGAGLGDERQERGVLFTAAPACPRRQRHVDDAVGARSARRPQDQRGRDD
jgi:hypothetical protein